MSTHDYFLHRLHLHRLHVHHHRLSPEAVGVLSALSLLMLLPADFCWGNALAALMFILAACAVATFTQIPIL